MAWRRNKEQAPASRGWKKWEQGAFGWLLRFLRHRFFEASGLLLILLSGFGLFSIFIYNPENPSLNYFDGEGVENWLGAKGAEVADILIQLLGLGTWAVFLAPLVLGIALLTHKSLKGLWWRTALWLTSPFLLAMGLDIMTQDKGGAAGRLLTQRLAEFFPISGIFWAVGIITTA
ncbi:MAG: DNA translocase FtsK 4TM domain-containing protein, partial [Parvibaculales bacterium]